MNEIHRNYMQLAERVARAADKAGKSPSDITIIGVTKTVGIEQISSFLALGNRNIGENKVQELLIKHAEIGSAADWHMIGHLQTNKVKSIIDKVRLIQSVDSYRLAKEIDSRAREIHKKIDVLLEINIAGEDSKFGITPSECSDFVTELLKFDGITIRGLMTVAPFVENAEDNRAYFKEMKKLFVDNQNHFLNNRHMEILSMGMTNDYEVAIEEGANMIRIGTGLFGAR